MSALAEKLFARALEKQAVIATAESCTAGLIAGAITDIAGSSAIFDRGFVTYSNAAKTQMLGVSAELIGAYGAVSQETARAMAEGALMRSDATLAIAVTGIAGPGASLNKPEGRVCFACAKRGQGTVSFQRNFGAIGRKNVRQATVDEALLCLINALG